MMAGIAEAMLLIALGLGYIVCYLANREEKALRTIGYFIGTFIIVLSSLLIMVNVFFAAKFRRKAMGMMIPHQKMMMPGQNMPAHMPDQPRK
jgi:ABC-type arginine transport system permease subunit